MRQSSPLRREYALDRSHGIRLDGRTARAYAPLDLPPGMSWIMMCEETSGGATTYTALIIPEDQSEPLRSRAIRYFTIPDALPESRARFQNGNSERLCVSCKVQGWCEM